MKVPRPEVFRIVQTITSNPSEVLSDLVFDRKYIWGALAALQKRDSKSERHDSADALQVAATKLSHAHRAGLTTRRTY